MDCRRVAFRIPAAENRHRLQGDQALDRNGHRAPSHGIGGGGHHRQAVRQPARRRDGHERLRQHHGNRSLTPSLLAGGVVV